MPDNFGDRIKLLRLKKNLSQEEFAILLGTSKQVISRYETNQRTPKITVVNDYAQKLNVPLRFLLGETENEKPVTVSDNELFNVLSKDDRKLRLVKWIATLDDHGLDRFEKILDIVDPPAKE